MLSYLYYFSFNAKNSLFMVAASLVIYLAALAMEHIQDKSDAYLKEHKAEIGREQKKKFKNSVKHKKRIILVIAMLINFGVLAVLKYGGFITGNITAVFNQSRKESIQDMSFRIILPTDYAGTYWKI